MGKIKYFILAVFSIIVLFGPSFQTRAICLEGDSTSLDDRAELILNNNDYCFGSQGFCIAGDYMIKTRWVNNSTPTIYQVIDINTMQEVGHYSFDTRHSNSLAYNPDDKEMVCVSDGVAYRFNVDENGVITEKDKINMNRHYIKVAYVSSEKMYYVSSGKHTVKTKDFKNNQEVFNPRENGMNQGMASDGEHLYVMWSKGSGEEIDEYTTSGELVRTLTLSHKVCYEMEEIDFHDGNLYVNVMSIPGQVLKIPQHIYGKESIVQKPTCVDEGYTEKKCKVCGETIEKTIPATGIHKDGEWEITKEPTCTEDGKQIMHCAVCGKEIKQEAIAAKGHVFGEYKVFRKATVSDEGQSMRECSVCHLMEEKTLPKLVPKLSITIKTLELPFYDNTQAVSWITEKGDAIENISSSDEGVVKVNEYGEINPGRPGKATVTVSTKAGAKQSFSVKVKFFGKTYLTTPAEENHKTKKDDGVEETLEDVEQIGQ